MILVNQTTLDLEVQKLQVMLQTALDITDIKLQQVE